MPAGADISDAYKVPRCTVASSNGKEYSAARGKEAHIMHDTATIEKPPTSRSLAKRATYVRVLEAAKILFLAEGFERTTIRDIAAKAGMSTGAVFANFENKADLFAAILQEDFTALTRAMKVSVRGKSAHDVFTEMLAAACAFYAKRIPFLQAKLTATWSSDVTVRTQLLKEKRALIAHFDAVGDGLLDRRQYPPEFVWMVYFTTLGSLANGELSVDEACSALPHLLGSLASGEPAADTACSRHGSRCQ
jgi:AcrR family transcriptional regulator